MSFETKLYNAHFTTVIVPRTANVWKGIYAVKELLPHCVFHRRCSNAVRVEGVEYMSGIDALENYQVGKMGANGKEARTPLHDACSHGADAFRTFVEGYNAGFVSRHGVGNWNVQCTRWGAGRAGALRCAGVLWVRGR